MINPLKFLQGVKQEAFRVTWPSKKETLTGAMMVVVLATLASLFFLLLDQILKFFLDIALTINF
jgi:preprotein translocase subunit SecE